VPRLGGNPRERHLGRKERRQGRVCEVASKGNMHVTAYKRPEDSHARVYRTSALGMVTRKKKGTGAGADATYPVLGLRSRP
jgi:hypothetical protein